MILSYEVIATTNQYIYRVLINAKNTKVLLAEKAFNNSSSEVQSKDGEVKAIGWQNDDGSYHLYNDENKISVFDFSKVKEKPTSADFSRYGVDTIYSNNNKFDKKGVYLLNYLSAFSNYFSELGDAGFYQIHSAINVNIDTNASGGGIFIEEDGTLHRYGILSVGRNRNIHDIDIIAHEYTHMVTISLMEWQGEQASAINEGFSDIFGEILEENLNGEMDWKHDGRIISDPENSNNKQRYPASLYYLENAQKYKEEQYYINKNQVEDYSHYASTIISHCAYLMWNGIDGKEQSKIDENTLAKIWYRSLFLLQSDATFSQCRNAVELSARSLWKSGKLTEKQYDTVIQAFNEVGIDRVSNYANKTLKNDFNMLVLNSEGKERVSTEIKIYPSATSSDIFFANKDTTVFEATFDSTSPEEGIHINLKDGRYLVEISDTATEKSTEPIGMIIEVDGNSKVATDNLTVYTDFKEITTVVLNNEKIDLDTIYINFLCSKGYNDLITDWYEVTPTDYAVVDINQDGKEELIVSGSQGFSSFYSFAIFGYDEETNSVFCYTYDTDNGITGNINDNDGLLQYYGSLRYSSKYKALMYSATNDGINNHYFSFDSLKDKKIYTEFMLAMETEYDTQIRSYYTNDTKIDEATYNAFIDELKPIEWTKIPNFESSNEGTSPSKDEGDNKKDGSKAVGKFYGNETPEQLRKSIIGSWGALGSIVPEYNFIDSKNCSGSMPWQANGTYSISDDKTFIISWAGKSEPEKYIWSRETWDEFYSHYDHDVYFWYMTDDGVLMINGKEKYREGVDNFTYNTDGDLMVAIAGTWISNNGFKEYRINSDGTWVESTVVVSGGTLISRTTLDNGEVEIIDNTTAKLWQETKSLSQIPGASELVYDSKNDKIFVGGTNNSFTRAKYK